MGDLITADDLGVYPVTIETAEMAFVNHLIGVASSTVVDAAGCQIKEARSTVTVLVMPGRTVRLPGSPIRAVHSVTRDGQTVEGWLKTGTGLYSSTAFSGRDPFELTVDYTHGLATIPADIADLVARMVIAGLYAGRDDDLALNNGMLSSVAVDDYKEAYATGDVEIVTEITLPERTKRSLRRRFGGGAHVSGSL